MFFAVLGVALIVIGIGIITIHGAPLRGTGAGTLSVIAGVVLGVVAYSKRAR